MQATPTQAPAPTSKSNTWKLVAIVVVILIVVGVAAYILTQNTTKAADVVMQDDSTCGPNDTSCLFNPASFNTTVNGVVTWRNDGHATHNITTNSTLNASGLTGPGSPNLVNGNTYPFTFTAKGTYHYYCSIHPWMKAVVNVN